MSRRSFVKTTGGLGALCALAGTAAAAQIKFQDTAVALAEPEDKIVWGHCNVNCGGRCVFQWHVKDNKIAYMESDTTGEADFQSRACLRGRSMRRWINSPDRLLYPMKRVGKRGEGKFERISWDEAIQTIADKLKYTIETYGNDAIFLTYATGMYASTGNPSQRLLNTLGGCLGRYGDYSTGMMQEAIKFFYGEDANPYDNVFASSYSEAQEHADLVIQFGNSPAETRMGGANAVWDYALMREAGPEIINIDYRMSETSSGNADEWIAIRPGTDAALASAIAYELITKDQVDIEFLHKYCLGYDEESLPASAKGKNLSYKDYILGSGYDKVAKTPEWAAQITQIPADKIRELADKIAQSKALFVNQGWGPQRRHNGELTTLAICMIPVLRGMIGKAGTNTGLREAEPGIAPVGNIPAGKNPVQASINVYQWLNAVDHGTEMTAINAGVRGADKLKNNIKFIWNYAGNCLTNQHADINKVHEILSDESKCEFILVWDTVMTDSARYADILLPDAMRSEQLSMSTNGYSEYYYGLMVGGPAQEAPGECRCSYDVMAEIADKFGKKEAFTEGRTHDEWVRFLYEQGRAADPELPTWEKMLEQGVYKKKMAPAIGLKDFVANPALHPLKTPSGKIEIYSERLAQLASSWELEEDELISPIPVFTPGYQGYGSVNEDYPLYCAGFHHKSRTHSSYGFIQELEQACRQQMWINPLDAEQRNIKTGDICSVKSPAGEIRIEARVTPRIIPGTIGIPQGAWHKAEMFGDKVDHGACVNTLTTYKPSALAKGNGSGHAIIAQVSKA